MFIGSASTACNMRAMFQVPGVQVVALVPAARPVPPPSMVVTPDIKASSTCWGEMKWITGVDRARRQQASLAGDDLRARSDHDVDPRLNVGVSSLAMALMRPP